MEKWKVIKQAPNFEVSNFGNVRHIKFKRNRKFRNKYGYSLITLSKKTYLVHRLVAESFINSNINGDIDHINRVRNDNRVDNLRVVTRQDNLLNQIKKHGVIEHVIDLYKQGYTPNEIRETLIAS